MHKKAPAVNITIVRSRFLFRVLVSFCLVPLVFVLITWLQAAVPLWHLLGALVYFLLSSLSLFWFYKRLFWGCIVCNGVEWTLQAVSQEATLIAKLRCVLDGQNHLLLRADRHWVWADASMCSAPQWLALRRAVFMDAL